MSYFLVDKNLTLGQQVEIQGEEARHILLSRRVKPGEQVFLQGNDGNRFLAEVVEAKRDHLIIKTLEAAKVPNELPVKISLFQAFVNEKALDFILQKSTELGAAEIALFNSVNVATKLSYDQFQKKYERWNKILWEAAKQSDRAKAPTLEFIPDLDSVIASASKFDQLLLLDPQAQPAKNMQVDKKTYGIVIGPEGGLTEQENNQIRELSNCLPVSLGPILLRAETAALAGLVTITSRI